ncbi:MAG TPA: glycosyltransferase [Prolixibacteraceae bacterium]|nr:glycosyltransferase [Prolixibacteraceae bacterium]
MKKIVVLYKFLPQYRKEFFNLLKIELAKHSIELELIYGKIANVDVLKGDEVDIEWARFIPNRTWKIGKTELLWQPCIKYLKDNDLVIVEGANRLILNYYLMIAKHFSKFKLAFWGHGRNLQENIGSNRNRFKYLFINKCDWWFGYTKGTKNFLMSNRFPEPKITVVQNAIDTISLRKCYNEISASDINDLKNQLGIKKCKTGIYCGAMYPDKKLDFVIETCYRIKREIPDFHMIFIGSGVESYKVLEASKYSDWMHYVGSKFGVERVRYFKIAQIQLMPYNVGLGIIDSFAMETPLITTFSPFHGPEIEYLENGVNGLLTKESIEDYSRTAIETLNSMVFLDLIKGCKLSAEVYTIETMVENFKNGVLSCLNTKAFNIN